jgi:hypothetical protein
MKRGTTELRRTVGAVTFEGTLPAVVCTACGEAFVAAEDVGRFELGIAAMLAGMGWGTPEAFRFMRKVLGFGGAELAKLLGVEPETVSRWENGARRLDLGAFAIVGGLVEDLAAGRKGTRQRLQALRQPAKTPKRAIRVDVPKRKAG